MFVFLKKCLANQLSRQIKFVTFLSFSFLINFLARKILNSNAKTIFAFNSFQKLILFIKINFIYSYLKIHSWTPTKTVRKSKCFSKPKSSIEVTTVIPSRSFSTPKSPKVPKPPILFFFYNLIFF